MGRVTIGILVVVTAGLAILTYSPTAAGNFLLSVSNQGSYCTQGIVVAFLLGIWQRWVASAGALAALVAVPVVALPLVSRRYRTPNLGPCLPWRRCLGRSATSGTVNG